MQMKFDTNFGHIAIHKMTVCKQKCCLMQDLDLYQSIKSVYANENPV